MSVPQPIFPAYGSGQSISTSTTAANATLAKGDYKQLRLTATTVGCYVKLTDSTSTAVATVADLLVPVGQALTISRGPEQTRISVTAVSATGLLHVCGCDGATAM